MANYEGRARTNYVAVKDLDALKEALDKMYSVELVESNGKCAFIFSQGSTKLYGDSENGENDIEIDFEDFFAPFMADGEICVVQCIGHEKDRYLVGLAYAFDSEKNIVSIDLDDIYRKAFKEFGTRPSPAQY